MLQSKIPKFRILVITIIIAVIVICSIYFLFSRNNAIPQPDTFGAVDFKGQVQSDMCSISNRLPIGDVGCSITVNNLQILIVHGNIHISQWGNLYGFSPIEDITHKEVEVHAHKSSEGYAISDSSDFVKLLN